MFILDTNVVSELRRPSRADPKVLAWAGKSPVAGFFLSSITVLELELGTLLMERKDASQGAVLRAWLDLQVLAPFAGRILREPDFAESTLIPVSAPGANLCEEKGFSLH
jgi:predicted nucleic acid-binding protein